MTDSIRITAQAVFMLLTLFVVLPANLLQMKRVVRGQDVRFATRTYSRATAPRGYWTVFVVSALSILACLWLCWGIYGRWTGRF